MKPYVVKLKVETKTYQLRSLPTPPDDKPQLIMTIAYHDSLLPIAAGSNVRHPFKRTMAWQRLRHQLFQCR